MYIAVPKSYLSIADKPLSLLVCRYSLKSIDPVLMAPTCVFLASKVEVWIFLWCSSTSSVSQLVVNDEHSTVPQVFISVISVEEVVFRGGDVAFTEALLPTVCCICALSIWSELKYSCPFRNLVLCPIPG